VKFEAEGREWGRGSWKGGSKLEYLWKSCKLMFNNCQHIQIILSENKQKKYHVHYYIPSRKEEAT